VVGERPDHLATSGVNPRRHWAHVIALTQSRRREPGRRKQSRSHRDPEVVDDGLFSWIYLGNNERMFVVGFTPGGAPYGPVEPFEPPSPCGADQQVGSDPF